MFCKLKSLIIILFIRKNKIGFCSIFLLEIQNLIVYMNLSTTTAVMVEESTTNFVSHLCRWMRNLFVVVVSLPVFFFFTVECTCFFNKSVSKDFCFCWSFVFPQISTALSVSSMSANHLPVDLLLLLLNTETNFSHTGSPMMIVMRLSSHLSIRLCPSLGRYLAWARQKCTTLPQFKSLQM